MERCDLPAPRKYPLALFDGFGIELEYMIVDCNTLDVLPWCDRLLQQISGTTDGEIYPEGEEGPVAWSNELALHVVEFKTLNPVPSLHGVDRLLAAQVDHVNDVLSRWNACLMPGAMHPWMDPLKEMRLWPHGCSEIYETFNRIFDCRGHGWANLQSVHINLPFADDGEFFRLHTAVRTVLSLLPGLASSSPVVQGRCNGVMDNRLEFYRNNCARIPQVTGKVIPEPVRNRREYETVLLQPIYDALHPLDTEGILRHEWVNARGAIARFDRGAIEIRLLDIQECPKADMAVAELVCAVVQALAQERFSSLEKQRALSTDALHTVLLDAIRRGDAAHVGYPPLLHCMNIPKDSAPLAEVWEMLARQVLPPDSPAWEVLNVIFSEGCLARRITRAVEREGAISLLPIYKTLCANLSANELFTG